MLCLLCARAGWCTRKFRRWLSENASLAVTQIVQYSFFPFFVLKKLPGQVSVLDEELQIRKQQVFLCGIHQCIIRSQTIMYSFTGDHQNILCSVLAIEAREEAREEELSCESSQSLRTNKFCRPCFEGLPSLWVIGSH
jgi:hypothetical protein